VDHGLEGADERQRAGKPRTGVLTLRAAKEGESIFLQIEDDGRGMDPDRLRGVAVQKGVLTAEQAAALSDEEALELITRPGFSTAERVTDISGRGVGMDVVKTTIEHLHGSLLIDSAPGQGTTITLRLPMSLAVIAVLMVRIGVERYAIPMYQVGTTVEVLEEEIQRAQGQEVVALGGDLVPLVRLGRALQCPRNGGAPAGTGRDAARSPLYAVLTQVRGRDVGMVVDEILSVQDVLVKPLDKALRGLRGFAGVTVMGDGSVVLILDLNAL
jgi:two-component system chemotaxis sensor kinase CheA